MYNKTSMIRKVENGYVVSIWGRIGDNSIQELELIFEEPKDLIIYLSQRYDWDWEELIKDLILYK